MHTLPFPIRARVLVAFVLFALAATATADNGGKVHVGAQAGLLGAGLVAGFDVSDRFALRAQLNRFDYSYDKAGAGNDYTGDLSLSSTALLADWHPGGPFRFTAGAVFNDNGLAVNAVSSGLDIGQSRYDGDLRVQMAFDRLAPYLGLGWSTGRGKPGFGTNIDVGVLVQGTPLVTASGQARVDGVGACRLAVTADGSATLTGSACTAPAFAGLRDDAMREHDELNDALADFELYPVASFGIAYRF